MWSYLEIKAERTPILQCPFGIKGNLQLSIYKGVHPILKITFQILKAEMAPRLRNFLDLPVIWEIDFNQHPFPVYPRMIQYLFNVSLSGGSIGVEEGGALFD